MLIKSHLHCLSVTITIISNHISTSSNFVDLAYLISNICPCLSHHRLDFIESDRKPSSHHLINNICLTSTTTSENHIYHHYQTKLAPSEKIFNQCSILKLSQMWSTVHSTRHVMICVQDLTISSFLKPYFMTLHG